MSAESNGACMSAPLQQDHWASDVNTRHKTWKGLFPIVLQDDDRLKKKECCFFLFFIRIKKKDSKIFFTSFYSEEVGISCNCFTIKAFHMNKLSAIKVVKKCNVIVEQEVSRRQVERSVKQELYSSWDKWTEAQSEVDQRSLSHTQTKVTVAA